MNTTVDPNALMRIAKMKSLAIYQTPLCQKLFSLAEDGQIDPQTVLTMRSVADFVLFTKKQISGKTGGLVKVLEISDNMGDGIRNINGAKLPKGSNVFFDEVHLRWAFGASEHVDLPFSGYTQQASWVSATANTTTLVNPFAVYNINPGLLNAELEIKCGGDILITLPVNELIKETSTTGVENTSAGKFKLYIPKLLKEDTILEFNLKFGTVTTTIENYTYVYVGLKGIITNVS